MTFALIIMIFPKIDKFRFPQEKNKVFILSILFSQFNFSHSSLLFLKHTPNALMRSSDNLMLYILSLLCLSFPTQIPSVLFLFINNPEKDPKVSISLHAKEMSSVDVQNKVVSSASCDILMLCVFRLF